MKQRDNSNYVKSNSIFNQTKSIKWWHTAIIYEIFPKSFYSNKESHCGDLQGIISKLEYLKNLGIDALWLCPIYESPFVDSGYDVADYYKINPDFGSLSDFKALMKAAHGYGIKIILDMVVNHTSASHPWFISACESRESPYRDYYIFREGKGNGYPNNWRSSKTLSSVWTYNQKTDDYYMHIYTQQQPDLNWENKQLREEIYKVLRFWLDLGIDGYRLDVINKIAKKSGLPNFDYDLDHPYADEMFENNPWVHEYIKELGQEVFKFYPEALVMGQIGGVTPKQAIDYVHPNNKELNLYLQFEHMDLDKGHEGHKKPWTAKAFRESLFSWQLLVYDGAWPTVFLGSHDATRLVAHFGNVNGKYLLLSAKMLAVLQLCLVGTQVIYMGDELGLSNVTYKSIHEFLDIRSHSIYRNRRNKGEDKEGILEDLRYVSRDNARYQIPWDLAKEMEKDSASILSFYKQLIHFKKSESVLLFGQIRPINQDDDHVFAYQRIHKNVILTVVANMSHIRVKLETSDYGEVIIHNYPAPYKLKLRPYEVRVYRWEKHIDNE